jgi:hypothetical protein
MRRLAITLGLLTLTSAAHAATASSYQTLKPQLVTSTGLAVSPSSARIVTQTVDDQLSVTVPGRATRVVSAPGCRLALAAGSQVLCTSGTSVDLRTGAQHPLTVQKLKLRHPGGTQRIGDITAAGTHWIAATIILEPDNGTAPVLINRASGRVLDLGNVTATPLKYSSTHYLDLDVKNPVQRLCTPVRHIPIEGGYQLVRIGQWTLQTTVSGMLLQQCGSATKRLLPQMARLGRDWAAWQHDQVVTLKHLSTGRVRRFSLAMKGSAGLSFSANRLVVSQLITEPNTTANSWAISIVPLK